MQDSRTDSSEMWTGGASAYDQARPAPPPALLDLLTQVIGQPRPALVVDLGSGTGLSTAIWAERAERVIGIEPNADMRGVATRKAAASPDAARIEYRDGVAQRTGLPDACADIVTCAQAFHWMEPTATLAEVARILRSGGLFAAYDYDAPPTIRWELDQLAQQMTARIVALVRQRTVERGSGSDRPLAIWPKDQHLTRLRESGHFRYTHEVALHHVEHGDAARYLAMMQSNAFSQQFQFTEQETGFDRLRQAALQSLGARPVPWYVSYHIRIGVR